jgi:hypothetical protein
MNRKQLNYLAMAKLVFAWLKTHKNEVINHPKLDELYNQLGELLGAIETKGVLQQANISGITRKKDAGETELIELLLQIKDALAAYAVVSANIELKSITSLTNSSIRQMRDIDLLLLSKNLQTQLNLHLAELDAFNVKPAMAETLTNAISNFEQSLTKPHEAMASKIVATRSLTDMFAQLRLEVLTAIDLLMAPQKRTIPELYSEYQNVRKLKDVAASHAGSKNPSSAKANNLPQ